MGGLGSAGAELLRLGENAIYRLRDEPIVVRVARHPDAVRKEVEVARWLAQHDFPAARLVEELTQLLVIDGRAITWWALIEEGSGPAEYTDLARLLKQLHNLPAPVSFELPAFEPMRQVRTRLDNAADTVSYSDVGYLHERHEQLQQEYDALTYELRPGPIHGDAHLGNIMCSPDGTVRLIDFEVFAWGPREWDASVLGAAYDGFGWMNGIEYARCAELYGWDSTRWSGFVVVRAVRELNMTSWLMQRCGESREIDDEVRKRIADLRAGHTIRRWGRF